MNIFNKFPLVIATSLSLTLSSAIQADELVLSAQQQLTEDILRQLIEFESTEEHPEQTRAALEAMAERLLGAGIPESDVVIVNPEPDLYGLVARMRGIQEQQPLLTMAHIDVVTASPDAWAFPPFTFGKKDGYYFGRGTQDNKAGVAHLVANFMRLQQEKFVPNRDLIMMLTGDEETAGRVADWLATEGRELINAEFALNTDAGGGEYDKDFKPRAFNVQTSEKVYQTYLLTSNNPGGHSSIPRPENAIIQLAQALVRIGEYQFPVRISDNTRLMFARSATLESGQTAADMAEMGTGNYSTAAAERLAQDPYINAIMRTTCVPTELTGGHAENALPRVATATINCRIVPGIEPANVRAKLEELVNDPAIQFTSVYDAKPSPASVMPAALQETLERLVDESWPGIPVIPEMSTGATDGLFMRNAGIPVFGVAGWFMRSSDIRAHGLDEKIGIAEFHAGTEFWYRVLTTLSKP
ncbi:MAG: M20/M25/M40 family metallo-hydrolase [Xanthomonadales bacterium]|nr:M20/M25/M40 family metallo-hydrolase [Xanthomonadales bacterium]